MSTLELETPSGLARVHLTAPDAPVAALVLGHGAGGGVQAPDLLIARDAALSAGVAVALVEQPYRVADRRSQPPARQLDAAWISVVQQLSDGQPELESGPDDLRGLPVIAGGRSAGARVACRTAAECDAVAVLCLAFPMLAPARKAASASAGAAAAERSSRLPELDAVAVPVLVVQGASDPFGIPPERPHRRVVVVPGNHSLRSAGEQIREAIRSWLPGVIAGISGGDAGRAVQSER